MSLLDRGLIYVTGKGGTGKTTVAASLALAGAAQGRRTIMCEVAEQRHLARLFAGGERGEVALDDNLWAMTLDPQEALEQWLAKQAGGAALKVLSRSQTFQYFVAAAPGAKEIITIAKVWELGQATRWTGATQTYDLVVVDAPASGHGVAMLRTPDTIGGITPGGPVGRQAGKVRKLLRDPQRTGYVAVCTPEELPVNETLALQDQLADAVGRGPDAIVLNGLFAQRLSAAEAAALQPRAAGDAAVRAALDHDARARAQRAQGRRLRRHATAPVVTLPYRFVGRLGLDDYRDLGQKLAKWV